MFGRIFFFHFFSIKTSKAKALIWYDVAICNFGSFNIHPWQPSSLRRQLTADRVSHQCWTWNNPKWCIANKYLSIKLVHKWDAVNMSAISCKMTLHPVYAPSSFLVSTLASINELGQIQTITLACRKMGELWTLGVTLNAKLF